MIGRWYRKIGIRVKVLRLRKWLLYLLRSKNEAIGV